MAYSGPDPFKPRQGGTGAQTLTGIVTGNGTASMTASAVTQHGVLIGGASNAVSSTAVGTAGHALISNGAGLDPTFQVISAGNTPKQYFFGAEGLQPLEANFATLEKLSGTNVNVFVRSFNDTTEQYVNSKLQVPSEIDSTGTVTFTAYVSAATAAASKNIGLTFGHLAINTSEDWDPASPYTEEDTGAVAIDATQDDVTLVTWTETVSNLGWAANDIVLFRISRDVSVANNLTGNMYLFSLAISIPRAV